MFEINRIDSDRGKKLLSLLTNQVSNVIKEFEESILSIEKHLTMGRIKSTLNFTLEQDYGSSELAKYYVTHPLRVAIFMVDWMKRTGNYSSDAIEATLVHNVIEKGVMDERQLNEFISPWVSVTVSALTQNRIEMQNPIKRNEYYQKIYKLDFFGQLIKFFDKLDNLYAICLNPDPAVRAKYIQEIEEYVRIIGQTYDSATMPYFDALIENSKRLGYYRPSL